MAAFLLSLFAPLAAHNGKIGCRVRIGDDHPWQDDAQHTPRPSFQKEITIAVGPFAIAIQVKLPDFLFKRHKPVEQKPVDQVKPRISSGEGTR
jgi:hypothetical protein